MAEKWASELFKCGYNCSQSVFAAHAAKFGIDTATALKLSAPLGGGVGRMREVCGAVSGMFMVAGLKYGYSDPSAKQEKAELYALVQNLAAGFKEKNGSIICKELLGVSDTSPTPEPRTAAYYKKRPCVELVGDAAELLENLSGK